MIQLLWHFESVEKEVRLIWRECNGWLALFDMGVKRANDNADFPVVNYIWKFWPLPRGDKFISPCSCLFSEKLMKYWSETWAIWAAIKFFCVTRFATTLRFHLPFFFSPHLGEVQKAINYIGAVDAWISTKWMAKKMAIGPCFPSWCFTELISRLTGVP